MQNQNMQVGANMKDGMVDKEAFKIVYVAPMKALAAEMTATFGKRLASLGEPLCVWIHTVTGVVRAKVMLLRQGHEAKPH